MNNARQLALSGRFSCAWGVLLDAIIGARLFVSLPMPNSKAEVVITYCTQCQWLLRAAWLAQELLSSFTDDLSRVSLEPGTGGVFRITCDGVQLWERKADGGFPEAKVLKQRLRDQIDPGRALGHNDRPAN